MDWKRLDRTRRSVGPVHLDLIEAYASRKISRRDFVRRGTIIGLSVPMIGAVIAACGDDDDTAAPTRPAAARRARRYPGTTGATGNHRRHPARRPGTGRQQGGTIRIAYQTPAATLDPIEMQDLGAYGLIAQCFEFLVTLGETASSLPVWPSRGSRTRTARCGRSSCARASSGRTAADFTSADVAATMDRLVEAANAGLAGVIAEGAVDATDPNVAVFNLEAPTATSRTSCRCSTPRRRSPRSTTRRARRSTARPTAPGRGSSELRPATGATFERNPDWWGGQTPLDGRSASSSTTWARWSRPCRAARSTRSSSSRCSAATRCSTTRLHRARGRVLDAPPDLDALRHGPVRRQGGPPGAGLHVRPRADGRDAVQGRAVIANDHVIAPFMPFFDDVGRPSGSRTSRWRQAAPRRRRRRRPPGDAPRRRPAGDPRARPAHPGQRRRGRDQPRARHREPRHVLRRPVVPGRAGRSAVLGAAELGIVDYGHRPTPDVFLNAALKTNGVWNSSQYSNPAFDEAFAEYQQAVGVDAQRGGGQDAAGAPQRRGADRAAVLLQLPVGPLEELPGRPGLGARSDVHREGVAGLSRARRRPAEGDHDPVRRPAGRAVGGHAVPPRRRSSS